MVLSFPIGGPQCAQLIYEPSNSHLLLSTLYIRQLPSFSSYLEIWKPRPRPWDYGTFVIKVMSGETVREYHRISWLDRQGHVAERTVSYELPLKLPKLPHIQSPDLACRSLVFLASHRAFWHLASSKIASHAVGIRICGSFVLQAAKAYRASCMEPHVYTQDAV